MDEKNWTGLAVRTDRSPRYLAVGYKDGRVVVRGSDRPDFLPPPTRWQRFKVWARAFLGRE